MSRDWAEKEETNNTRKRPQMEWMPPSVALLVSSRSMGCAALTALPPPHADKGPPGADRPKGEKPSRSSASLRTSMSPINLALLCIEPHISTQNMVAAQIRDIAMPIAATRQPRLLGETCASRRRYLTVLNRRQPLFGASVLRNRASFPLGSRMLLRTGRGGNGGKPERWRDASV